MKYLKPKRKCHFIVKKDFHLALKCRFKTKFYLNIGLALSGGKRTTILFKIRFSFFFSSKFLVNPSLVSTSLQCLQFQKTEENKGSVYQQNCISLWQVYKIQATLSS